MSCLGSLGANFVKRNGWSVNTLQIGLFVSGYWDDYPGLKTAMLAFFGVSMVIILGGFGVLGYAFSQNKGRYVADGNAVQPRDPEVWRRTQATPMQILTWQLTIQLILVTLLLEGFSSGTAEAVQMGAWIEVLLALEMFYASTVDEPFRVTWRQKFTLYLGILVGYLVNQFLVGATANIYLQVLLSLITVVGDLGQGVFTVLYVIRERPTLNSNSFTIDSAANLAAWLHAGLAWNHLLMFGLPVILCSHIHAAAIIMTTFGAINVLLLASYVYWAYQYWVYYSEAYPNVPAIL